MRYPDFFERANPLIMVVLKIESRIPHWQTPATVHELKGEN